MSQTAITLAFEQWKASQAVTGEPVLLDEFVFANVPGLDASKPIVRGRATDRKRCVSQSGKRDQLPG